MRRLLDLVFGPWAMPALVAGAAAVLFGWWQIDRAQQRAVGEKRASVKIEKANDAAVKTVNRARDGSAARGVRGARDPYTVDP